MMHLIRMIERQDRDGKGMDAKLTGWMDGWMEYPRAFHIGIQRTDESIAMQTSNEKGFVGHENFSDGVKGYQKAFSSVPFVFQSDLQKTGMHAWMKNSFVILHGGFEMSIFVVGVSADSRAQ